MLGQSNSLFKLSRSKIELFVDCPRCFYFDRRLGIGRPPGFPFNLNIAVDQLLKNEFDTYRIKGEPHPLMEIHGLDAIPFQHEDLDTWRENFKGIRYHHGDTNFLVTGAIDDIWQTPEGKLIIVDYKATSKQGVLSEISQVHFAYKRQMDIYRWLFERNGFEVDERGYFVYCNGLKNKSSFNRHLEFDVYLIPYLGDNSWVESTLFDIYQCLEKSEYPKASAKCPYCAYSQSVRENL